MDIVVTLPKSEYETSTQEDKYAVKQITDGKQVYQYWSIGRKPKALMPGDRVYFIENGHIVYYHKFLKYTDNAKCKVTNRVWKGVNLVIDYPPVKLDNPIQMKGFQGFRYINFEKYSQ